MDLSECIFGDHDDGSCVVKGVSTSQDGVLSENVSVSLSRDRLVEEQKSDPGLSDLFDCAVPDGDMDSTAKGYFLRNGLLM